MTKEIQYTTEVCSCIAENETGVTWENYTIGIYSGNTSDGCVDEEPI